MKKISYLRVFYILLSLFFASFTYAQIITFSSTEVRDAFLDASQIYGFTDANGNGEVDVAEAEATSVLTVAQCPDNLLFSDLVHFSNLSSLKFLDGQINEFNISAFPQLWYLMVNVVQSIDVSNAVSLKELYVTGSFSSIDFSNSTSIEKIEIYYNPNLYQINGINDLPSLLSLSITHTGLSHIDLSQYENPLLDMLILSNNEFEEVYLPQYGDIEYLSLAGNLISHVDLYNFSQMHGYSFANNPNLRSINIQNCTLATGVLSGPIGFDNCPNLESICVDTEFWWQNIITEIDLSENISPDLMVYMGQYCGSDYMFNTQWRYDEDGNGCVDTDPIMNNMSFNLNSANYNYDVQIQNPNQFYFSVDSVATITPIVNPNYFTVSPPYIEVDFSSYTEVPTLEFCISPVGVHNDLAIELIPINDVIPGDSVKYKIIYKNLGSSNLSGNITLDLQDDFMDIVEAAPEVSSMMPNQASWSFDNLAPLMQEEIYFTVLLNSSTQSEFPLNTGEILHFTATINPINGDENEADNVSVLNQEVINSADSDNKILLEGEYILLEQVGEYVHYRIRFENTGAAPAVNIRVEDNIDPNSFDISSLEVVDASHEVIAEVNGDVVQFNFFNINLPFEEGNNEGYVVFKIKTLNSLQLNDTFDNQAEIYFDYNATISTNEFTTTVSETLLDIEDISDPNQTLIISPNPVKNQFQIRFDQDIQKVEIFDENGRLIKIFLGQSEYYNVSELTSGFYWVVVHSSDNKNISKVLIE